MPLTQQVKGGRLSIHDLTLLNDVRPQKLNHQMLYATTIEQAMFVLQRTCVVDHRSTAIFCVDKFGAVSFGPIILKPGISRGN